MSPLCLSRAKLWTGALLALSSGSLVHSQAAIVTTTSGVYDENVVRGNAVDASYSGTFTAGTAPTNASFLPVATFTSDVATAFANGLGGVINFDDQSGVQTSIPDITASFAGGAQTLGITGGSYTIDMSQISAVGSSPISGGIYLRSGTTQTFTFSLGLQELGYTVLARAGARTFTTTLTYSDGTTGSFSSTVATNPNIPSSASFNTTSAPDTFYGYAAPAGLTIKTVAFSGGVNLVFDDVAFVVPEPGSALLGMVGLLAVAGGRWRRRC